MRNIVAFSFLVCLSIFAILFVGLTSYREAQMEKIRHRSIFKKHTIDFSEFRTFNDRPQWVRAKGPGNPNPWILYIHSLGRPMSVYNHLLAPSLSEDINVVHWDQYGSGKSYVNDSGRYSQLSLESLTSDLNELIRFINKKWSPKDLYLISHGFAAALVSGLDQDLPVSGIIYIAPVFDAKRRLFQAKFYDRSNESFLAEQSLYAVDYSIGDQLGRVKGEIRTQNALKDKLTNWSWSELNLPRVRSLVILNESAEVVGREGLEVIEISQSGDYPHIEKAEEFTKVLSDFVGHSDSE